MARKPIVLFFFLFFIMIASSAYSASYYVSGDASGTSTTCTAALPCADWRNISQFISVAANDFLNAEYGTPTRGNYSTGVSGSANNPVTIQSNGTQGPANWWGSKSFNTSAQWIQVAPNYWQTTGDKFYNPGGTWYSFIAWNTSGFNRQGGYRLANRSANWSGLTSNYACSFNTTTSNYTCYSDIGNPGTAWGGVEVPYFDFGGLNGLLVLNQTSFNIVNGIDFAFVTDTGIYVQLGSNINITNNRFTAVYGKNVILNGDGSNSKSNYWIINNTFNNTGLKGATAYQGSQGECIYWQSVKNVHVMNNTLDHCYGVNINGLTSVNDTIMGNQLHNVPFDSAPPACIYDEGSNNTVAKFNSFDHCIVGMNIGYEALTKRANNYEYSYNWGTTTTNFVNGNGGTTEHFITNANISHNTFIMSDCQASYANSRLWYLDNFENLTMKDNAWINNCTNTPSVSFVAYYWENKSSNQSIFFSDYNAFYSYQNGNKWNWTISNTGQTTYNDLASYSAATTEDSHSIFADPLFVNFSAGDYHPLLASPLCHASSTGSYIGAFPCIVGFRSGIDISGISAYNVTNQSVIINWTNPGGDYNYTLVSQNGVVINNITTPNHIINIVDLNASSNYNFTLTTYDDFGDFGNNFTVSVTTIATNFSLPPPPINNTLIDSSTTAQFIFLQKPYFFWFNVSVNFLNTQVVGDRQATAPTYVCDSSVFYNCPAGNDGSDSTQTSITSGWYRQTKEVTKTFPINSSYTDKQIQARMRFNIYDSSLNLYCLNATAQQPIYSVSNVGVISSVDYDVNVTVPSNCIVSNAVELHYKMYNDRSDIGGHFFEGSIFSYSPAFIKANNILVNQSTTDGSYYAFNNITGIANNMTGNVFNLTYGTRGQSDFIVNYNYSYIYTKDVNVSIYQNGTTSLVNASCTMNGRTFYPETTLVTFNSSQPNQLICSKIFYNNVGTNLTPQFDAINLSIVPQNRQLILIDERTNAPFDVQNLTSVILYYDDNNTAFDFKANNTNVVNFTQLQSFKVRLELKYITGVTITRYVNLGLDTDTQVRVCANKEGITHYEQEVISATERPVFFKSVYANCLIAADYTRFNDQSTKSLKAYSIDSLYYLFTFDDAGNQIMLSSIDGSIQAYIDLDALLLQMNTIAANIPTDSLVVEKTGGTTLRLLYTNTKGDNVAAQLAISRVGDGGVFLNTTSFADPNNIDVLMDSAVLGMNSTDNALVTLTLTKADGTTSTKTFYTNGTPVTKSIPTGVAVLISVLFFIFGLTLAATETTYNIFGIIVMLVSIGILAFAITAWYILFMMAIEFIMLVFIIITMNFKTPRFIQ